MTEPPHQPLSLRALIHEFIHNRFATKTEKLAEDDPAYLKLQEQFDPPTWLADAARRVSQLQVVTHSLKGVHPDAKGTNLYVEPGQLDRPGLVGSHCLPADFQGDVVGNAAALDVYKFLKLQWQGRSLLELSLDGDEALIEALSKDRDQAQAWVHAFAQIVEPKGTPGSHARGKQVYWLTGDEPADNSHYHLLAPLYATALIHPFHARLSDARFGEHAKAGRKARRDDAVFDGEYSDYLNLAVQKLGGTKPQNISQLNSERGGQNYLLASLPPHWISRDVTPPLRTESVLPRFGRRAPVRQLVNDLVNWVKQNMKEDERRAQSGRAPRKTYQHHDLHDDLTAMLADELLMFTFELHRLAPGWSSDSECRLVTAERYWLDPGRSELDADFATARQRSDWHEEISQRFAGWLKNTLAKRLKIGLADPEHDYWVVRIERVLENFRRQLDAMQDALRDDDDNHSGEPT
ncbi:MULTISPECIES: type I-F CRISPR-associated protein Csy1 [unclassified Halomonas]|uniref:type I-F CRISPR-associated protein Csy1 n=1 Tax=unclassified Halomonas TaxID=2609666 RepID=UPI0020A0FF2C|nr:MULTISPECIES: type I-F CRISPR-associated protein Csy1 [unclassified Halomonas]MCP1314538.1 type I-F CRISPR-associated protein Csy1 [Halomonas sp. 707D7]MCP1325983.1 type I-F CRISPR-associated protein Csy1 [Halomonas sp. 707D4]